MLPPNASYEELERAFFGDENDTQRALAPEALRPPLTAKRINGDQMRRSPRALRL